MASRKGQKAIRNQPLFYNELKKKHGIWLTDTSWHKLQDIANKKDISVSELIEKIARSLKLEDFL